jgi:hypothetical protein
MLDANVAVKTAAESEYSDGNFRTIAKVLMCEGNEKFINDATGSVMRGSKKYYN